MAGNRSFTVCSPCSNVIPVRSIDHFRSQPRRSAGLDGEGGPGTGRYPYLSAGVGARPVGTASESRAALCRSAARCPPPYPRHHHTFHPPRSSAAGDVNGCCCHGHPPTAALLSQWTGRHRAQGRRPVSRVRWAEAPGWPLARPDTALTLADRSVAGGSRLDIDSGERVAREPAAAASMIRWLRYHGFGIGVYCGGPHVRHRVRVTLRQLLPRDRRGEELACEVGSCWWVACLPRSW